MSHKHDSPAFPGNSRTNDPLVLSIQVGLPKHLGTQGASDPMDRPWFTGAFKEPVQGPVWLGSTNLAGDGQANLQVHGGPDKAVLAYAALHYPAWRGELNLSEFTYGAFAENFTVSELTEELVCIGDIYLVGEARVQVSSPRQPCWKNSRRWRIKDLSLQMQNNGRTGWYFRVIKEGYVEKGLSLRLLERPYPRWTVACANEAMHRRREDRELAAQLAACPVLGASWRETFSARAKGKETAAPQRRLWGGIDPALA